MSVVWSYHAMRMSETTAPFLAFFWHYLTNLWQMSRLHSTEGGYYGLLLIGEASKPNFFYSRPRKVQIYKRLQPLGKYRCYWNRWSFSMCTLGTRMHILVLPGFPNLTYSYLVYFHLSLSSFYRWIDPWISSILSDVPQGGNLIVNLILFLILCLFFL